MKATGGWGSLKVLNSIACHIQGVSHGVKVNLGAWVGQLDLSVVSIDDFTVVLGMEFIHQVKAFPVPFANSMCIMDGEKARVVPTERSTKAGNTILSTLQFKKSLRREEDSYLAILKAHDDEELEPQASFTMEVQVMLDDFKDVMSDALPKKLPSRREVDHKIELEIGTRLPTMSPYKMALPKLAKLRKQLMLVSSKPPKPYMAPWCYSKRRMARYGCELTTGLLTRLQ